MTLQKTLVPTAAGPGMKRRALLSATGTVAVGLVGCLGRSSNAPADVAWSHDVGGRVDAVAEGRVFFREEWGDDTDGDGSISALDAETGEHLWSYGSSQASTSFTDLTVADAVYVGHHDRTVEGRDEGELNAVEFDGSERWTVDTGRFHGGPRLSDDVVYVGSEEGVVRAVDAGTGEVRWREEVEMDDSVGPTGPAVEAVDGYAVYVVTDRLLALDPATGDRLWYYGDGGGSIDSAVVHDGVAYVGDGYDVRAVEDGAELWSVTPADRSYPRVSVDGGRVFVAAGTSVLRFDADDGGQRWRVDVDELGDWTVHGDRLYAAGEALHVIDADDGAERWSESVGDGTLRRLQVATDVDATGGDDHAAFVPRGDSAVHRVSPDGEVNWSASFPWDVWSLVVHDLVYVGTEEGVSAFDTG